MAELSSKHDIGYELTTSLAINADNGTPVAPVEMHLKTGRAFLSTRNPAPLPVMHTDQILPTMPASVLWNLGRPIVYVIDREAGPALYHVRRARLQVAAAAVILYRLARKSIRKKRVEVPGRPLPMRLIWSVRRHHRAPQFMATHSDLKQKLTALLRQLLHSQFIQNQQVRFQIAIQNSLMTFKGFVMQEVADTIEDASIVDCVTLTNQFGPSCVSEVSRTEADRKRSRPYGGNRSRQLRCEFRPGRNSQQSEATASHGFRGLLCFRKSGPRPAGRTAGGRDPDLLQRSAESNRDNLKIQKADK
jgi:hypothetical protein